MRRIYIDNKVRQLADEYARTVFRKPIRRKDFEHPILRLRKLWHFFKDEGKEKEAEYVYQIVHNYKKLLTLEPDFSALYKGVFDTMSEDELKAVVYVSDEVHANTSIPQKMAFYELIVWAMRYGDLREKDYLRFADRLNIHTCVYCNAQYTITLHNVVDSKNKKTPDVALYQLDHFLPKSKYPHLCTSFFNLQPSCANCNLHKLDKDAKFNLYTNRLEDVSPFKFVIETKEDVDGVHDYSVDDISISLEAEKALKDNHNDLFMVEGIYQKHKREAQEAIIRLKFYNDSYRNQMQNSLSELFPDGVESPERFFWAHELDESRVHDRPLNKLVQDIVKYYKE